MLQTIRRLQGEQPRARYVDTWHVIRPRRPELRPVHRRADRSVIIGGVGRALIIRRSRERVGRALEGFDALVNRGRLDAGGQRATSDWLKLIRSEIEIERVVDRCLLDIRQHERESAQILLGIPERAGEIRNNLKLDPTPWKDAEWSCIRRDLDGREELFRLSEDPNEQRNLAEDSGVQDVLRQLRTALERLTLGPLLPGRFQP